MQWKYQRRKWWIYSSYGIIQLTLALKEPTFIINTHTHTRTHPHTDEKIKDQWCEVTHSDAKLISNEARATTQISEFLMHFFTSLCFSMSWNKSIQTSKWFQPLEMRHSSLLPHSPSTVCFIQIVLKHSKVKWKFSVVSNSLQHYGLHSPWKSPGQHTGMGSVSLLQGIFPTQASNPGLLQADSLPTELSGKPTETYSNSLFLTKETMELFHTMSFHPFQHLFTGIVFQPRKTTCCFIFSSTLWTSMHCLYSPWEAPTPIFPVKIPQVLSDQITPCLL